MAKTMGKKRIREFIIDRIKEEMGYGIRNWGAIADDVVDEIRQIIKGKIFVIDDTMVKANGGNDYFHGYKEGKKAGRNQVLNELLEELK